jgi:hypothetical protein
MKFKQVDLGVQTADAERVEMRFVGDVLTLHFLDWKEEPRGVTFERVLGFRWQEFDEQDVRDDSVYEVLDSAWLERQAALHGVTPRDHAHYALCFNACGTLDVLCRRFPTSPSA